MATPESVTLTPDELVERLFTATLGAMDLFSVYLGDRLGYYRALADQGPATSTELAQRSGTAERYAREWLEQQAATNILTCANPEAEATERRFQLPDGYDAVLTDPTSLTTMVPAAQLFAGCVKPLPQILEAYRTGNGVPYEDYGADTHDGIAAFNRPAFVHLLTHEWLPAITDVHARLQTDPPARVADIGMGQGWSSITIAKGYPNVLVDGFDLDEVSVTAARANAEAAGIQDRVAFHCRDAGDSDLAGHYDLAIAIECIHDMANPVAALASMRRLIGENGAVVVVDEKVEDRFTAPGDDVERLMYGFSILHCLPVGMAEQPSVGTGTVIRESTMRRYAEEAGFRATEVLPIEYDFFRFYRLHA
ncbi:MAG: methyltransferase domain-containing protein [Thermomicrobiales bacterium]